MCLAASEAVVDETQASSQTHCMSYLDSVWITCLCVLCITTVRTAGASHLPISHSQQKHTAGKLKDHLKPGAIQEASHLKKSSDSGFHNGMLALIPYR